MLAGENWTSSRDEWWVRMNAGTVDGTNTRRPMIHKIPELFRQKESCKGCFDPIVVSIGPYHHGKCGLQDMQRLKYSLTRNFVGNREEQLRALYDGVQQIYADARGYYPEETVSRFDANAFTTLMLVDGCFVLQFIHNFLNNSNEEYMRSNVAAFVRRDLMLLENQLPYIVLEMLIGLQGNVGDELIDRFISSFRGDLFPQTTCIQTTFKFFDKCCSIVKDPCSLCNNGAVNQSPAEEPNNNNIRLHLLDIFLRTYINRRDLMRNYFQGRQGRDWYSYPAAKELRTLGIHFRPSAGEHFTDIEFRSTLVAGWLFLPQIMIDDTSKSMLLNLVAYEASPDAPNDDCGLTSYICFMDSLIDQADDVKVLRSKGIVFNLLGSDQQAAELFNDIAQDLVPNPYAFRVTRQSIDSHSRSRIRTWMAEWIHNHFSSPWTFIAFIAVTATIFMTFVQTFFTVKGYRSGNGR